MNFLALALAVALSSSANAFIVSNNIRLRAASLSMSDGSVTDGFNPKNEPGVTAPLGFFDPLGICPTEVEEFRKFREAEIKHGRVAMLAVLGFVIGESGLTFFGDSINGPAIYQFQQAESSINAFTQNVIGLILAIESYNIVAGWQPAKDTFASTSGIANLKKGYVNGDLKFDPLEFKPLTAEGFKRVQAKELNNGRLAMLAIAGLVAQELVTGDKIF